MVVEGGDSRSLVICNLLSNNINRPGLGRGISFGGKMETQIIIAVISSGLLTTIINRIFNYLDKRAELKSGVTHGVRLILKDRLRFLCVRYIEQGWIYEDELEDLVSMHSCYHDTLAGNGYLDELMGRVKRLPMKGVGIK